MVKTKLFNWIGGKKWLAKDLNEIYSNILSNKNIDTYIEPFAGGLGSFLYTLETLKNYKVRKFILNDVNTTIISIYKEIKNNPEKLFEDYWKIEESYKKTVPNSVLSLHKTKQKEEIKKLLIDSRDFYELKKKEFNCLKRTNILESIPYFLFLSQHSFNGVYRENSKGDFNTPFNWEAGLINREDKLSVFLEYNKIFNDIDIEFYNESAFVFIERFLNQKNVMFYLDPPYLNKDISENKYNKDHFGLKEQIILLNYIKNMDCVVFSNHYLDIFIDFCKENSINYKEVLRSNLINSDPSKRNEKIKEILAYKY